MDRVFVLRSEQHAAQLHAFLKQNAKPMAAQGRPLAVHVTEHKAKRSTEQNRLLWATLNQIAEGAWLGGRQFSADSWHEFYKRKFIGCEELPDGSQVGISTTTLSVGEFSDYIERIRQHAATELGIELI
jgi:hypothetical protein